MGDPPPPLDPPQPRCIATTDHLPCDVIRSLWLVQLLNLEVDKIKRRFHHDAKTTTIESDDPKLWQRIQRDTQRVEWLNSQAVAETEALLRQLKSHRQWLLDTAAHHDNVKAVKQQAKERQNNLEMRLQLMKHYEDHPLNSHLEALKENAPKEKLKLVLKVPASAKMVAAKPKKATRPAVGLPRLKTANNKPVNGIIPVTRELRQRNKTPTPAPQPVVPVTINQTLELTPRRTRSSTPVPTPASKPTTTHKSTNTPKLTTTSKPATTSKPVTESKSTSGSKSVSKPIVVSKPATTSKSTAESKKTTQSKPITKATPKANNTIKLTPKPASTTAPKPRVGRPRKTPTKVEEMEPEVDEPENDEPVYCFCKTPSLGNMIACDNLSCPNGEWFHFKCVGLLNRVQALKYTLGNEKWYCSDGCRQAAQSTAKNSNKRKKRRTGY